MRKLEKGKMMAEICFAETYKRNRLAIMNYRWWRGGELPIWEDLEEKAVKVGEHEYAYRHGDGFSEPVTIERTKINTHPFFRDLEKPLLVKNEMNTYHWEYLMDNVRASEDFGADNHIYMQYESMALFTLLLQTADVSPYLESEKFVIFIGDKATVSRHYPINFCQEYGIDYALSGPKPVRIDEIQRIIFDWAAGSANGNVFFAGVLDNHRNLLTMGELSMGGFPYFYEKILKNHNVKEALRAIKNTHDGLAVVEPAWLFKAHFASNKKPPYPSKKNFIQLMEQWFPNGYRPTREEWLKALFLAYAEALGRNMNQRIIPAIVFHTHAYYYGYDAEDMISIIRLFKYYKIFSPLRRFTTTLGRSVNSAITGERFGIYTYYQSYLRLFCGKIGGIMSLSNKDYNKVRSTFLYLPPNDEFLPYRGVVRFEDMKLQPRATAESLCDFFDIPWDDSLLSVTVNGVEGNFGDTSGFDTSPVYRKYEVYNNPFDYYRMELILSDVFAPWGYKPMYYTDGARYSKKEIIGLFEKKFKCEDYLFTLKQQKDNNKQRQMLYDLVNSFISISEENTRELVPIPWIKPKRDYIEGELYE